MANPLTTISSSSSSTTTSFAILLLLFASVVIADDLYSDPLLAQSDQQQPDLSPLYNTNYNLAPPPLIVPSYPDSPNFDPPAPAPSPTTDDGSYAAASPSNAAPIYDVASEGPQYAPIGPSSAPPPNATLSQSQPTSNYDQPIDDVATPPVSEALQYAPYGPSSASPPDAAPIDDVATGPEGPQNAPFGSSSAPTSSWTGSVQGEQPPPSDAVDATIGGGGIEEINAAEEGEGGGWGEKKASEVVYWVMGSACFVGFGTYLYNNKKMEEDKRRRRKWEYQSLTKRNEKKHEVELPILA